MLELALDPRFAREPAQRDRIATGVHRLHRDLAAGRAIGLDATLAHAAGTEQLAGDVAIASVGCRERCDRFALEQLDDRARRVDDRSAAALLQLHGIGIRHRLTEL